MSRLADKACSGDVIMCNLSTLDIDQFSNECNEKSNEIL